MIIKSTLVFLCVVSVGFSIVWVFSHPSFQINKISVSGNKVLSEGELRAIAQKNLSGNYFFLFPRANTLLYPKKTIQNEISSAFPRANSVELSLEDNALLISLSEREPEALWCGTEKNRATTDPGCFYMDKTGYVFDESPNFSGDAYFKFYGKGLLQGGNPVGRNFISADFFKKVFDLRAMLGKYGKKTVEIFLGDDERAELLADSGCKIVFNADQEFLPLKSNMEAVFKSSEWGKKISGADKCADLEYVDFRFGNKIYYKQKGIETLPAENAADAEVTPAEEDVASSTVTVEMPDFEMAVAG
ncbi:MAG: hypothetical protein WCT48_03835 [Candidatus Paceibacterota bacterium]